MIFSAQIAGYYTLTVITLLLNQSNALEPIRLLNPSSDKLVWVDLGYTEVVDAPVYVDL